jgi:hypothetical protein
MATAVLYRGTAGGVRGWVVTQALLAEPERYTSLCRHYPEGAVGTEGVVGTNNNEFF